jgi:hypothetical protein
MYKLALIASLAVATSASADILIDVDVSVANQLSISATFGLSAATVSGSNFTGIYLDGLSTGLSDTAGTTLISSDFSSAFNPTDGTPQLFVAGGGTDTGLNIWSFSLDSTVDFVAGSQAFTGSATWSISSSLYASLRAGELIGDIYFPADDSGDISSAQVLGTYRIIPAPSASALFGICGLVTSRRRR